VLNGARIGKNSLVGAGALVTEGQGVSRQQSDYRIAGPGRPHLDDDAVARLRDSADHYVENARRFAAGLSRQASEDT
jgi:carbonic anhydrase/acetyltransferase-like protein (isoleucine patch superfamily)